MQEEAHARGMSILVEVLDPVRVESGGTSDDLKVKKGRRHGPRVSRDNLGSQPQRKS